MTYEIHAPSDPSIPPSSKVGPGELDLESILAQEIDWRFKSFPPTERPVTIAEVGRQGWSALGGDLLFPLLLIKEKALDHNIALMARYCRHHGVSLAPHGKTPLAPQILQRQLEAGAWGVSAATLHQARVFRTFGIQRILIANGVFEPLALGWIVDQLAQDPEFEVYILADSVAQVALITDALETISPMRRIPVLVEMGVPGGRTGCRTREDAVAVSEAITQAEYLELAGVEGYEGAIHGATDEETLARIDAFLKSLRALVGDVDRRGFFAGRNEIIVSAGGSLFFDRVVDALQSPWDLSLPARIVLRSGAYAAHDAETYARLSPLAGRGAGGDHLEQSLELWALVLSVPEPGLAILGFGKRDAPYDLGLPIPFVLRRAGEPILRGNGLAVTEVNDQHAFMHVDPCIDVRVGDMVGCHISHPCTAFDKWRLLPLVDDDYRITGAIATFF
jgi:D-serine dehydratase